MECEICDYYQASEVVEYACEGFLESREWDILDLAYIVVCDRCFAKLDDSIVRDSYPIAD